MPFEIGLGLGARARIPVASSRLVVTLVLAAACSDDGLANQSSGQVETSTTGGVAQDGDGTGNGGTSPEGDATSASPPASGTGSEGPAEDSGTLGPESGTDTGTGTGTASGTDTGTGSETEGTTGGPSQACADGCAVEHTCGTEWASAEECVAWCEANLVEASLFSPFCRDAWEALSACLATLTCEEFMEWQSPAMFPYPCSDADVALSVECKGQ